MTSIYHDNDLGHTAFKSPLLCFRLHYVTPRQDIATPVLQVFTLDDIIIPGQMQLREVNMKKNFLLSLLALLAGCATVSSPKLKPREEAMSPFEVIGELSQRNAEISGMSWCGDWLIFLPQYPDFAGSGSLLYGVSRENILAAIGGKNAITPVKIPFSYQNAVTGIQNFEGFEAIVFQDTTMFLTIEAHSDVGYLIKGTIASDMSAANLDASSLTPIALPAEVANAGYESMSLHNDTIFLWYEANGANNNPHPTIVRYSTQLQPSGIQLDMPVVEYRITDASQPMTQDPQQLWLINYFWPGDLQSYNPAPDQIAAIWGLPASHASGQRVERLLPLTMDAGGSAVTVGEPVYLQLRADGESRNWEAIALVNDEFAILATDKYPTTIIGFVKIGKD